MKPNKKAAIEVQFNWLFVLIAGAVILLVFTSFIVKQRSAHDQALAESLVTDIKFLAEGAASAKKAWQVVEGSSKAVEARCEEDCSCNLNVGSYSQSFGGLSLFIPSPLSGQELVFWSQDWEVPFRTTNMLYMSSKNVKYWLVYDPSVPQSQFLLDRITDVFPDELIMETVQIDQLSSIEDEDFDDVKIIFLHTGFFGPDVADALDPSLADINFMGLLIDMQARQLTFYRNEEEGEFLIYTTEAPFSGMATIFAGIFSNEENMYKCGLQNALERAYSVINIYLERTRTLDKEVPLQTCSYQQAIPLMESMATQADENAFQLRRLDFPIEDLEIINRDLLNQGCPLMY